MPVYILITGFSLKHSDAFPVWLALIGSILDIFGIWLREWRNPDWRRMNATDVVPLRFDYSSIFWITLLIFDLIVHSQCLAKVGRKAKFFLWRCYRLAHAHWLRVVIVSFWIFLLSHIYAEASHHSERQQSRNIDSIYDHPVDIMCFVVFLFLGAFSLLPLLFIGVLVAFMAFLAFISLFLPFIFLLGFLCIFLSLPFLIVFVPFLLIADAFTTSWRPGNSDDDEYLTASEGSSSDESWSDLEMDQSDSEEVYRHET